MAVAAHHEEIRSRIRRIGQERVANVAGHRQLLEFGLEPMARQMARDVEARQFLVGRAGPEMVTTSIVFAFSSSGIASDNARAAAWLPSHAISARSKRGGLLWMRGTNNTGRPELNSADSGQQLIVAVGSWPWR